METVVSLAADATPRLSAEESRLAAKPGEDCGRAEHERERLLVGCGEKKRPGKGHEQEAGPPDNLGVSDQLPRDFPKQHQPH